jgi:hypothetical protein
MVLCVYVDPATYHRVPFVSRPAASYSGGCDCIESQLVSSHLYFSEVHRRKYNSFYCETFILWFVTHKHCSRRESVAGASYKLQSCQSSNRGSIPNKGKRFFSSPNVRTGHGSHLTCSLDASNDLWNGKATGSTRCHLVPRLRISEAMPLILRRPLRRVQRFYLLPNPLYVSSFLFVSCIHVCGNVSESLPW